MIYHRTTHDISLDTAETTQQRSDYFFHAFKYQDGIEPF